MILELEPTSRNMSFAIPLFQKVKGIGASLEISWLLKKQNPTVPWSFYKVGNQAVFYANGEESSLCGIPDSPEEFSTFMNFLNLPSFLSNHYIPKNWVAQPLQVLQRNAQFTNQNFFSPLPFIDKNPPMAEIANLLAKQHHWSVSQEQSLYFNGCLRRNYHHAAIWGIYQGKMLVSTASLFAITDTTALLSNVETLPQWQNRGYAKNLIQNLCQEYSTKTIELVCKESLIPFYQTLHFQKIGTLFTVTQK